MNRLKALAPRLPGDAGQGRASPFFTYLGHALLFLAALAFSYAVYSRLGLNILLVAVVALLGCGIYALISLRHLQVPFMLWLATIGGFRFLLFIRTPVLPDLSLDRLAMIWVAMVFIIKLIAERRSLRRPFTLDVLLLAMGGYMWWRIWLNDMFAFHAWTMFYLVPFAAFFLAKNIVYDLKWVKVLLLVLLGLSIYYNITSVAEKLKLAWLIWPKYILSSELGKPFAGRSRGPFTQAALFGTIIGMLLPLYLYFIANARNRLLTYLGYAGLALGCAGLYFTYTRGSWLAGVIALLACTALGFRRYGRILIPFTAVVVLAGAGGLLGLGEDKFMQERLENQQTIESRMATAATVLQVWRDNPIFGVGFFEYRRIKMEYVQSIDLPVVGTVKKSIQQGSVIHDIYWGPLAEYGLVGFLLQNGIYLAMFVSWRRKYRLRHEGDPFARDILPVFMGIYAGYLVGGAVIDYRYFSFVSALFYTCAGLVDGYDPASARAEAGRPAPLARGAAAPSAG